MNVINKKTALQKLNNGLPIIFQTDTLPAIGCLPKFSETIYQIKKRDRQKPLILMGSEKMQLTDFVDHSAIEDYENVASKYWPGPLTIIIPVKESKKKFVTSKNLTLGLRIPNSNMAQSLMKITGPLLTSSANISGNQGSLTPEEISLDFPNVDILGPIPWDKCSGSASTIISWVKYKNWELIRKGQTTLKEFI